MPKGLLIDTVRCTGCRGCQSACKQWNLLPGWGEAPSDEYDTSFSPTMTNPPQLNAYTYNHVEFYEIPKDNGEISWHFIHTRCLHCIDPACVSVCPVGALQKFDNGPVVWDQTRCFGCRYCQNACPFDMPKFQWEQAWPKIQKCTFCWNRLEEGMEPACAKTCPPNAIEFGERDELLARAHERIRNNPDKYYDYVYGEHEAGGTSIMYINAVAPEKLGLNTDVKKESYPDYTWEFLSKIPVEIAAIAALLGGTWYFRKKRLEGKASVTSGKEAK